MIPHIATRARGSVDCAAKFLRARVAVDGRRRGGFVVRIRASNDDLKGISILSCIGSLSGRNRSSPQSALIVRRTWRIRAFLGIGVDRGISLKVHVEGYTTGCLIAFGSTGKGIKAGECIETHVIGSR